ncbi:transmembrane channel-like protein 5 [Phascolarctos cinereus]|uniref:Transmembrane channel-like protein n=1 Tax=Phascolarctos cinereus TaxID=38626 RepID=A0A6P5IFZ9_PHACI|nr:transmembrane channel-like protein 5 isoform X2 [Phascolarctos cinereus]
MTAFYSNQGYEEEPDYPDFSNSRANLDSLNGPDYLYCWNNSNNLKFKDNAKFSSTHNYPDYPDALNSPDYPGAEDYLDNLGFRNHQEYPGSHTNTSFSRSQRTPDYPGPRSSSYHSRSKHSLDSFRFMTIPDYPGAEDYQDSREDPDPGNNAYRSSSRSYPDRLGSLGIPDYQGAEDNLGTPDNWGSAYIQNSQNNHGYSYSEKPEMGRGAGNESHHSGLFHRTLGAPERDNRDYPDSFQMTSRQPTSLYSMYPVPDRDGDEYRNLAYEDESSLVGDYGNQHLGRKVNSFGWRRNWHEDALQAHDPTFMNIADKTKHEEKLVASLVNLPSRDRSKIIRNQPLTMQEKRKIKKKVNMEKQKPASHSVQLNYCTQCLTATALYYRHFKNIMSEFFQSLHVWQRTLKIIGSKFGTSVLSYFSFLTWLLKFNIFSFIVNFGFIVIPQLTDPKPNNVSFTGLELLTGAGSFQQTVLYYGFYSNSTIKHKGSNTSYNMQLAYIFTIGLYLVICFFSLLYSMACSFRNNFINPHVYSRGTAKLVFSWDFTITCEKAVKLKQRNLIIELKENLSEIRLENVITPLKQRLSRLCIHLAAWIVSTGVAVACCAAVYFLASNNMKFLREHKNQAATLLLPFLVCCINLFVPLFYSSFGLVEKFEIPRHQVLVIITRNIFLKISIIGILCYYWLNSVAVSQEECWETLIGQDIYRLLMMNFFFTLFDSIFGEFLRRIIGTKLIKSLGVPEFDIARNVLELIYTQTLLWIGIFFSPLLPFIHMITLFIMLNVKRISLMMNCLPPSKVWRASQMMTLFIFLLFFPSFTGVLCVLAITVWRLKPSAQCGPFQGLPSIIHAIYGWIEILSNRPSYLWVVWIYRNLIGSVHFFFILTLIVVIITYLYWQIIEGRKIMIKLLHEQIINEGKDKMFLVEKLLKLQDSQKKPSTFPPAQERREQEMESRNSLDMPTDLSRRSRTSLRNQNSVFMEEHFNHDTRQHTGITDEDSSEALRLAMMAKQQSVMER